MFIEDLSWQTCLHIVQVLPHFLPPQHHNVTSVRLKKWTLGELAFELKPKWHLNSFKHRSWVIYLFLSLFFFFFVVKEDNCFEASERGHNIWIERINNSFWQQEDFELELGLAGLWYIYHDIHSKSGEGNGNPLQYSCLENPMDRGAWGAIVHGVTESQTRLSD